MNTVATPAAGMAAKGGARAPLPKIDTDALLARVDIVEVIGRYLPLKKSGVEYEACCPFHTEKTPSFKVSKVKQIYSCFGCGETGDAIRFVQRHAGLSFVEACKALGAGDLPASPAPSVADEAPAVADTKAPDWSVLMPVPADAGDPHVAHVVRGRPEARWAYRDAAGSVLGYVYRFRTSDGGKETLPHVFAESADGKRREWRWLSFPMPRPLYGLDRLASAAADAVVLVVEGEKCADAAHAVVGDHFAVVSWPGGGKAVKKADWTPLAGRKVLVWPDCDGKRVPLTRDERAAGASQDDKPLLDEADQPGWKAAAAIGEQLQALGCTVEYVRIPAPLERPDGWDVADMVADGADKSAVLELMAHTVPVPAARPAEKPKAAAQVELPVAEDESALSDEDRLTRQVERMLDRYAFVHGTSKVWDYVAKMTMTVTALGRSVGKVQADAWMGHPRRKVLLPDDVKVLEREQDDSFQDSIDRYVYLDGSDSIWDNQLRKIISSKAAKMAMGRGFDVWQNSPMRRVIPLENLVFDPTQRVNPSTHINQFRGFPLQPAGDKSKCRAILSLSYHLCGGRADVWWWLMNWIAYPLQHPGSKMATAILMHGKTQGTGKSLFWQGCVAPMYGEEYAATLDQDQLEANYQSWRSKRLFGLFEEVIQSSHKYSLAGKIKHMITGSTQTIERKFVDAWEEKNHMNMVFLSNLVQPIHVEESDRRFMVIWINEHCPQQLQSDVAVEIENGGIEAFYNYLLSLPLTLDGKQGSEKFHPHTKPMMTDEKQRVISYGLTGWELFYRLWSTDQLPIPYCSCKSADLARAYWHWSQSARETSMISENKFSESMSAILPRATRWYRVHGGQRKQAMIFRVGVKPDDMSGEEWLGRDVHSFHVSLKSYLEYGERA